MTQLAGAALFATVVLFAAWSGWRAWRIVRDYDPHCTYQVKAGAGVPGWEPGQVLYVGYSKDPVERMRRHEREYRKGDPLHWWWPLAEEQTRLHYEPGVVRWHRTKPLARRAERAWAEEFDPPGNTLLVRRDRPRRRTAPIIHPPTVKVAPHVDDE